MKLSCTVHIADRQQTSVSNGNRKVQSSITFFKNPKSEKYYLIIFTSKNKTGQRYQIQENTKAVLTRFLSEGKATIQFKVPAHDILIQADSIRLKHFLSILRNILLGKKDLNITCTADYVPYKPPVTKLVIKRRSDYPAKGFPRTLEILIINDIERSSLDRGVLLLFKLKVLDLQNNNLETIPQELNTLPNLSEIYLRKNNLGSAPMGRWKWLGGNISKTLKLLDLAENNIKILPLDVIRLYSLHTLNVGSNEIRKLPQGIGRLRNLKVLIVANNLLTTVPGLLQYLKLESIDATGNDFDLLEEPGHPTVAEPYPVQIAPDDAPLKRTLLTLKEVSAQAVLRSQIPYTSNDLPLNLVDFLDFANYCLCGKPCYTPLQRNTRMVSLCKVARAYSTTTFNRFAIPFECFYCSTNCRALFTLFRT